MRFNYILLLIFCFLSFVSSYLIAQDGLTDDDYIAMDAAVKALFEGKYQRSGITKVDSAIGNLYVSDGQIEDPYGTLNGLYIFNGVGISQDSYTPKGFIGIYKDGQVIWHSDTLVYNEGILGGYTYATRDLDRDENVEIITSWIYFQKWGPHYMWIFSWDGQTGRLISAVNDEGQSVIYSHSGSNFEFVDVDGDGIMEIQGWHDIDSNEPVTYSWNGQLYGKWPDTPQPSPSTFFPRDRIDIEFHAFVKKIPSGFKYQYLIESLLTSIQEVSDIKVECQIDSVDSFYFRKNWEFYFWDDLLGWMNSLPPLNLIHPGEGDSSCAYESNGLPNIVRYFVQGFNQTPTGDYSGEEWWLDVQNNSAYGFTIGAADPPDFFIPSAFLDTLMTYPHRSYELGWIDNQGIENSLEKKLQNAKKQLDKGKIKTTVNQLNAFVNEVEAQKEKHLTSEAYALLKYNAEYLIEKLEE